MWSVPAQAVHGCLAGVVCAPGGDVASSRARAHEDDTAAERALAQLGEGGPEGGDEREEVGVEVLPPLLDRHIVGRDLAQRFERARVENDAVNAFVFLHPLGYSGANSSGIGTTLLAMLRTREQDEARWDTYTSHSNAIKDSPWASMRPWRSGPLVRDNATTFASKVPRRSFAMAKPRPLWREISGGRGKSDGVCTWTRR